MKTKLLVVLLFLNVLFLSAGFYFFKRTPPISSTDPKPASASERWQSFKTTKKSATGKEPTSLPEIVYVTNRFNWSQVESSDYREYIANLRSIGCPESTIKDIIFTDILKLYAARRGQFYQNGREFRFWETDEKRKLNARQLQERERQLALIDKEIPSVLRELLGVNYEREMNKYFVDTNEDERRLSFLPQDKRDALLSLRDKIEGMREQILDRAQGHLSKEDAEALQKIEEQRQSELKTLLSGAELAEFELRTSPTADRLRADLIGFNPSESEFREIFAMQTAIDEKFAYADVNDATVQQQKKDAERELREKLKSQLGDARYAEYERAQNPDFRNAVVFTEIYELPTSTAQALYEIKQVAETEKLNLLRNPSVSESDRLEVLKAIQAETEKALRETLGANVFAKYNQGTGKWVENLGTAN